MHEPEPIDLSPLDPDADPERWRTVVEGTLSRIDGVLAVRPRDPLSLIASWSRSLTLTGALVVLLLIPVEIAFDSREARAEQVETLVRLSTETALGAVPTGEQLSEALSSDLLP